MTTQNKWQLCCSTDLIDKFMAEILVKFKADTNDFNTAVSDSLSNVQQMAKQSGTSIDDINKAYKDLGKQIASSMGQDGLKQLKESSAAATKEANRLGTEYRKALDEAAKTGQKSSKYIKDLEERMQEASDTAIGLEKALEGAEEAVANGDVDAGFFGNIVNKAGEASKGMADMKAAADTLPGPLKDVANGALGLVQTFKMFTKIPILTLLYALVGAFELVKKWLTSTKEGQEENIAISAKMQAIMQGITNTAVKMGEYLYKAFKAMYDMWHQLYEWMDKLPGPIMANIPILGQFYNAAKLLEALDTSDQLVDTTGLDEAYQKCKTLGELFEEIGRQELKLTIDKGDFEVESAKLDTNIAKLQNKIAEGVDPSQRMESIDEAMTLINEKYAKQIDLAKRALELKKAKDATGDNTHEDDIETKKLEADLIRLQGQQASEQKRLTSQRANMLKTIHTQEVARKKELANLNLEMEKAYISMKQDSLNKTIELIEIERKKQLQSIESQEEAWRNAQRRKVTGTDEQGQEIEMEESYLTEEQMQYLANKRKQINATTNADIAKTTKEWQEKLNKELLTLNDSFEKEKLQAQEDSLDKTLALLEQESKAKRTALEQQKDTWVKEQGALTEEQQKYYDSRKAWIDASLEDDKSEAITKAYETTANKFKTIAERYVKDIKHLDDDQAEVATDKLNKDALALVSGDDRLKTNLEAFKTTLADTTLTSLNALIAELENQLSGIQDQTSTEAMMLRAQLTTAKNQAQEMSKAITDKKPADSISKLNSNLSKASSNLKGLGETAGGEFGEVAKVMSEIIDTTQDLVNAFVDVSKQMNKLSDTLVATGTKTAEKMADVTDKTIDGIEATQTAGVAAVKAVETASVILAIISLVMQATQAIVKLAQHTDNMAAIRNEVRETNLAIKKAMNDLELSRNKLENVFGSDTFGSLVEATKDAMLYLEKFNTAVEDLGTQTIGRGLGMNMLDKLGLGPTFNDALGENIDSLSAFEKSLLMIQEMQAKTQHKTWFRNSEYKAIKDLNVDILQYKDGMLDIEASMEALREFTNSDLFGKLSDSNQDSITEMLEDWDSYQEAIQQMTDAMKDWFGGIADAWGDSMVAAFETGEDAAESFKQSVGDSLRSMVKEMLIGQYITRYFDDAAEKLVELESSQQWQEMTDTSKAQSMADIVTEAADKAVGQLDAASDAYAKINEYLNEKGYLSSSEASSSSGTLSGAIQGASQESIDLLSGYCNAVRIQQVEANDLLREQLVSLSGIESNTAKAASYCKRIADRLDAQTTEGDSLRAAGL